MSNPVEIWEKPEAKEIFMLAGWRQWADAGSMSSGLPKFLVQQLNAKQIGKIQADNFYLFQFPGTHDLVRPVVRFKSGFPEALDTPTNEFYYAGDKKRGFIIFIGDEPHLNIDRYVNGLLQTAKDLGVKRIVTFGGVYGELPYDKERMVSCIYSQPKLKDEIKGLAVTFSDYQGGASIGSYVCRRAAEQGMDMIGFYAFVPLYDFSNVIPGNNTIRIENDFSAWLSVMQRVNHLLKTQIDLSNLEKKSKRLLKLLDDKISEIEQASTEFNIRDYFKRLSEEFSETHFDPLDDVWENELRRLFDKFDNGEEEIEE